MMKNEKPRRKVTGYPDKVLFQKNSQME